MTASQVVCSGSAQPSAADFPRPAGAVALRMAAYATAAARDAAIPHRMQPRSTVPRCRTVYCDVWREVHKGTYERGDYNGQGGIRTHDTREGIPVFETG